ncbi:hypothetical protein PENSPDRAFT_695706, partial [Peniophora sp. CONT]
KPTRYKAIEPDDPSDEEPRARTASVYVAVPPRRASLKRKSPEADAESAIPPPRTKDKGKGRAQDVEPEEEDWRNAFATGEYDADLAAAAVEDDDEPFDADLFFNYDSPVEKKQKASGSNVLLSDAEEAPPVKQRRRP